MNELFVKVSPILDRFFSVAYCDTRHCEEIDTLEWNGNDAQIVLRNNKSFVNAKDLTELMNTTRNTNSFKLCKRKAESELNGVGTKEQKQERKNS